MHHKLIKGILTPSNAEAAETSNIRNQFYRDMTEHHISNLVLRWGGDWHDEGLEFDRSTPVLKTDKDGVAFIRALSKALKQEAGTVLKFNGELRVTVETDADPINYRIYVQDSKVYYQKASYVWDAVAPFTE